MSDQNDLAALLLGIAKETEKIIKFKAQARVQVDDQVNRIEQCSDVSHVQRESIAKLQNWKFIYRQLTKNCDTPVTNKKT